MAIGKASECSFDLITICMFRNREIMQDIFNNLVIFRLSSVRMTSTFECSNVDNTRKMCEATWRSTGTGCLEAVVFSSWRFQRHLHVVGATQVGLGGPDGLWLVPTNLCYYVIVNHVSKSKTCKLKYYLNQDVKSLVTGPLSSSYCKPSVWLLSQDSLVRTSSFICVPYSYSR